MSFFNPSNYSTKGAYLTKTEALRLFRQNTPNIFITGNEIVSGDESVYGNSNTETLTVTESAVINNLTTYGSTYIGTDNLQQHRVIGDLLLTKLPQLTSNITPSNEKDLITKKYADDKFGSMMGYNTWNNTNNFTSGFMIGNALTFSPSNLVFNKMPITDIDRTADIIDDKNFVVKKYCDDKFASKTTTNTWTNSNTFNNSLIVQGTTPTPSSSIYMQVRYAAKFSETEGNIFYTIPKIDLVNPSITDDKHIVTKKFVDDKFASKAGVNTYSAFNEFQGGVRCRYNWTSDDSGTTFTTVPKLLVNVSSITDDNHVITKEFLNNKFNSSNTFGGTSTTQTMFNNTVTNKLVVSYCLEAPTNESVILDHIPKTRTDKTSQITLDEHLTTKKYVDQLYSVPRNPTYPTKFLVCQQTSYEAINGKFKVSPPKLQNNGWDCYINFQSSNGARVFMANTVTIEYDWTYSHNKKLTNLAGYVNNGDGTYTFNNAPSSADIQNYFEHRTNIPSGVGQYKTEYSSKSMTGILTLQPQSSPATVKVNSVYQSQSVLSQSTTGGSTWIAYDAPCTYPTDVSNESNTRVYWRCHPISLVPVSDYKIRLNIKFPQICKSPSNVMAQSNDPSLDGWISNAMCSISIRSSPFAEGTATLLSSTAPNTSFRADTGNAYFTLT